MHCYFCEVEGGPSGTRYGIRQAVGVCADCGVGVCLQHAHREAAGEPLRCPECQHRCRIAPFHRPEMACGDHQPGPGRQILAPRSTDHVVMPCRIAGGCL